MILNIFKKTDTGHKAGERGFLKKFGTTKKKKKKKKKMMMKKKKKKKMKKKKTKKKKKKKKKKEKTKRLLQTEQQVGLKQQQQQQQQQLRFFISDQTSYHLPNGTTYETKNRSGSIKKIFVQKHSSGQLVVTAPP